MQPNFISTRGQHSLFAGLALVCAVLVSACSFHVSGESKTGAGTQASTGAKSSSSAKSSGEASAKSSGSAKSQASAKSSGKSSSSMKVSTGASGSSKASSSGSVKIGASTSGKSSKSVKFSFKTKARTSGVKRAKKSDNFRGTFLVGGGVKARGSASGSASVKGSGSASGSGSGATKTPPKKTPPKSEEPTKTPPKKEEPTKTPPKKTPPKSEEPTKTPPKKTPPKSEEPTKTPPKKEEPAPAPTPAPVPPPVVVIDPPAEPPENVFGYEQPVRGCFEGIVYPLAPNTAKLPTNWVEADALSVVYACEWDIPVRAWEVGFPGVAERFEWFALQYKGSFAVATTGLWKFRISSDDGAKLFIDGKLVIDNDGTHAPQVKEGSLVLTAGDHDMVLEYFQGPRYHINLQLFSTPPGGEEGIFSVR